MASFSILSTRKTINVSSGTYNGSRTEIAAYAGCCEKGTTNITGNADKLTLSIEKDPSTASWCSYGFNSTIDNTGKPIWVYCAQNTSTAQRSVTLKLKSADGSTAVGQLQFIQQGATSSTPSTPVIEAGKTYYVNFDNSSTDWITTNISFTGGAQLLTSSFIVLSSYDITTIASYINLLSKLYTKFGTQHASANYKKIMYKVDTDGGLSLNDYPNSEGYVCLDIMVPADSTDADTIVNSTWYSKGKDYVGTYLYMFRISQTGAKVLAKAKCNVAMGSVSQNPSAPTTDVTIENYH